MARTRRLLGPVAIHGEGNRVVSVDLGTFVTRLLLEDLMEARVGIERKRHVDTT
jgi:hypothetical protein